MKRDSGVERYQYVLAAALIVLYLYMLLSIYLSNGPSWDTISHYLSSRSLIAHEATGQRLSLSGYTKEDGPLYYEVFRAPLTILGMVPFILATEYSVFGTPIFAYLIALFALNALALLVFSREIGVGPALTFSLLLNPFMVFFIYVWDSEAALALPLLILGATYLLKRDWRSGVFFGLASLSAYITIAFLPMVLLLRKPRDIAKALAAEAACLLPWLTINQLAFGNPFYSFTSSFGIAFGYASGISAGSVDAIALIPVVFAVAAALLFAAGRKKLPRIAAALTYRNAVFASFIALSIVAYVPVALHHNSFDQMRFGYLPAGAALLFLACIIQQQRDRLSLVGGATSRLAAAVPVVLFLVSLAFLFSYFGSLLSYHAQASALTAIYNTSEYAHAKEELALLNLSGCAVVSNAWPMLLYYNVLSYSPYANYTNLPIVYFENAGVNASTISDLNESKVVYTGDNFSILEPAGSACTTST